MQFLAIIRRRTEAFSDDEFANVLEPEAEYVRTAYIDGAVRSVWSRGDKPGAVLMLEADSEDAVRAVLDGLPLMRRGMAETEFVVPLRGYRGFAPRA